MELTYQNILKKCGYSPHLAHDLCVRMGIDDPQIERVSHEFSLLIIEDLTNAARGNGRTTVVQKMRSIAYTFDELRHIYTNCSACIDSQVKSEILRDMIKRASSFREKVLLHETLTPEMPERHRIYEELLAKGTFQDWLTVYLYLDFKRPSPIINTALSRMVNILKAESEPGVVAVPLVPNNQGVVINPNLEEP